MHRWLKFSFSIPILLGLGLSCEYQSNETVELSENDMIIYNGTIYTVDSIPTAEAVIVRSDTILYVGGMQGVKAFNTTKAQEIDLQGKVMVPGLIDAHAHLMGIGFNLLNVDLKDAKSYSEVVELVANRADELTPGTWIVGRGWHQDKWIEMPEMTSGFPTHEMLSEAVPDHPVFLKHASGHAALVNTVAMELGSINSETQQPEGGEIFLGIDGRPTGILNETAMELVKDIIPSDTKSKRVQALEMALQHCFENGITGFHDAGSDRDEIELFKEYALNEQLKLRLYVMLSGDEPDLLGDYFEKGRELNLYDRLTIRSVKLYADGALGSRGAWLLEEYSDAPGVHGHNVVPIEDIDRITAKAYKAGFQVCVHAIGDKANREILDIYEKTFKLYPENAPKEPRFRIEHAQHFHPDDIPRFAELGVIPSMQSIHMSSDRPWAIDRLGQERIEWGAYMWQSLLQSGVKIANGTDAPVEPIDPIANFYAGVTRKTLEGSPSSGYEPEEKMSREQALRSMTIDAAYAAFQEKHKGSISVGKWADFTILDQDIMTVSEDQLLNTEVSMTIIGGEIVYSKEN